MNNHRKLTVARGGVTHAVPLVVRKSGGYAPKKHRGGRAFTQLVVVWAALTMTTAIAADLEAAGMVKTSRGEVTVDRAGQQSPAPVGTPVFVGDRVRTGPGSYVGITLRDDTLLTGGPQSTLLITNFQFNVITRDGNMLISFLKGAFSVVTGLIGKQAPHAVEFRTPSMALGIHGTEFIVEVAGAAE